MIFGAGPIGCCYALRLARAGWSVTVIEWRQMSECCKTSGRSVNMVLGSKGWTMLKDLGYQTLIEQMVVPMVGRRIHDRFTPGTTKDQPYGKPGQSLDSINRSDLNALLIKKVMVEKRVTIEFGIGYDPKYNKTENQILLTDKRIINPLDYDLVIGADGINSAMREFFEKQSYTKGTKKSLKYGYIEIDFPASETGDYILPKGHLHIWPLGSTMLIALPNPDGTFTGGLFAPFEGENSFDSIMENGVEKFYKENFPYITQLVPNIVTQHEKGKMSGLSEIRYDKWHHGNMVLVGDAAHAVTPFLGQGMNFGMYLCGKFCDLLETNTVENAINLYERFHTEANLLADWSLGNFEEMANTDNLNLNLRKKIEARLEKECNEFASFHSMVCFRNTDYPVIRDLTEKQNVAFTKVLQLPNVNQCWETELWEEIKNLMLVA